MREFPVGVIVHYYGRLGVGVIQLEEPLFEGDEIHIEGHTTNFEQTVRSMEMDHKRIRTAWPGDSVALLVKQRVRPGDRLFVRDQVQDREQHWEKELVGFPVLLAAAQSVGGGEGDERRIDRKSKTLFSENRRGNTFD